VLKSEISGVESCDTNGASHLISLGDKLESFESSVSPLELQPAIYGDIKEPSFIVILSPPSWLLAQFIRPSQLSIFPSSISYISQHGC
jgi:hypothetical protein